MFMKGNTAATIIGIVYVFFWVTLASIKVVQEMATPWYLPITVGIVVGIPYVCGYYSR